MRYALILCYFISCLSITNTKGQSIETPNGTISKKEIIKDLDKYADAINEYHTSPYENISHNDFYSKIQNLQEHGNDYDIDELLVKWMQVNALIGDSRTSIHYQPQQGYPFVFHWYEEGYFIIATNDDNRKYYHAQLVAINNVPIDEVVARIATILPDANPQSVKLRVPYCIIDPVIMHGLQISPDRGSIVYTIITPEGKTVRLIPGLIERRDQNQITGFKSDNFLRTSRHGKYWFKYIDTSNIVYFNYRDCTDDGSLTHVIEDLEDVIEQKNPKKIVIDIRYNTGGHADLLMPLINYLGKSSLNRRGGIYVLIGPMTDGAAVLDAAAFKRQTNAILVGEETGGTVERFGNVKATILPHTQLKLSYPTTHFTSYDIYKGTLSPDVRVVEKFSEYDNDIDSPVDYALDQ